MVITIEASFQIRSTLIHDFLIKIQSLDKLIQSEMTIIQFEYRICINSVYITLILLIVVLIFIIYFR